VVSRPDDVVALVAYLVFAVGASVLVNRFSRRSHQAERARAEAQVLAQVVATVGTSHDDLLPLLDALRAVFDATGVAIRKRVDDVWSIDVVSGEPLVDDVAMTSFPIDEDYSLDVAGVSLDLEDRQLINAFAGRIAASLRAVSNALEANEFRALARVEAVRTGLLRVVSGDVGESLASIRVTVSTLLDGVATAPARVQRERLIAVESEIDTLVRLIDNLVDLGRLEEGTLTPRWTSASMNVLVTQALESVETERRTLDVDVVRDLPSLETDVEIARRAITLVVERAVRSSAAGETVSITAGVERHTLELLVIDRGAGLDAATRASILDPLRRFGDPTGDSTMGLRVAAGFVDLVGGRLRFEDTPGCGLTVGLAFPLPSA
jgi:two-component system sensor histidine kinase KdpD